MTDDELLHEYHFGPKKVTRNYKTPEARAFWEGIDACAKEVATWPTWKKAGFVAPAGYDGQPESEDTYDGF